MSRKFLKRWDKDNWNMKIFRAQKGNCCYCNKPMVVPSDPEWEQSNPNIATREHLQKRCDGGKDTLDNLALAHKSCNKRKKKS